MGIVDAKMKAKTHVLRHFIDLIGFAHIEPCNTSNRPRLHGHNASVTLSLRFSNDEVDWESVQDLVSKAKLIVKSFDHVVLLPEHLVSLHSSHVNMFVGEKRYSFPKQDVLLLKTNSARIDDISRALLGRLREAILVSENSPFDFTIILEVSLRFGLSSTQSLRIQG